MSRIPDGHSVSVTYITDGGEEMPVYWEYRNSAMGELICAGVRDNKTLIWWDPAGSEVQMSKLPRPVQLVLADKGVTLP